MRALILSGGKAPSKELLLSLVKDVDLIIGADKGCETLKKYNIIPHYIVGDFDSASKEIIKILESKGVRKIQFQKEKDFTDTDIAFNLAVEKGALEIVLLGVTGTRYDHSLSNIGLLKKALDLNIKAKIIDDNNKIFLTNKPLVLTGNKGDTISFLAYFNKVNKLTLKGCKYELNNYDLEVGDGLTTSNEFLESPINVNFESGILMILYTKD
ncbi:thiamine diphosphokinase [Clostridium carnis]